MHSSRPISIEEAPDRAALLTKGVGAFLREPGD
jgi:hypothetical protein